MTFVLLFLLASEADVARLFFERKPVKLVGGEDFYLEISTDMLCIDNRLYIVENRAHRIQIFQMGDQITHAGTLAEKGEGPGEVWLPFSLAEWKNMGVVVKDNRGLSLFDATGNFIKRFRTYTPPLGLSTLGNEIFYMTPRTETDDLIDVYQTDGTRARSLFPRYLGLDGDDESLLQHTRYFYIGSLLSDEHHLYYLNATQGDFYKFEPGGEVLRERDIVEEIGPTAGFVQERVAEYMKDPKKHLVPEGFIVHRLFQDAYLTNGRIYVLRWGSSDPDYVSDINDILVYDTSDLRLVDHLQFKKEEGERVWSFFVWDNGTRARIFLSMLTHGDDDFQLQELVR